MHEIVNKFLRKSLVRISPSATFVEKKKVRMKTTATYSPMNACRNPKVSARKVAEYLVVSNNMLPTNHYLYILNLISSDGEIDRQGASLATRPAGSCLES